MSSTWVGLLPLLWPIVLGVIVGALIGAVAQLDIKKVLFLGVTMGAVMELIPRITKLFIDTIPYEVLTGVSNRVKRVYFQD